MKKLTTQNTIEAWLLATLQDEVDEISNRLHDISTHGCESGVVSELIYTTDCLRFYAQFEETIWEIITHYLEDMGVTLGDFLNSLKIEGLDALKVTLSWFSIEHSAYRLLNCLEGSHET
jgi:hypothetical protein